MNFIDKVNNTLLFLLAALVPFVTTFQRSRFLQLIDFKYISLLLVAFYLVYLMVSNRAIIIKPGKLSICLIAFFLVEVTSGFFSYDFDLAFGKIVLELQLLVIFLVLNTMIINDQSYKSIFKGLLIGFAMSCLIAIFQKLGFKQFYLFSASELNTNAGVVNEGGTIFYRIWGTFGNSLSFSEYLSVTGLILYSYQRFILKKKLFPFLILLIGFYCILLTVGRTALFSFGFIFLFSEFLYNQGKSKNKIAYLIFFSIIIFVAFVFVSSSLQTDGVPLFYRLVNSEHDFKNARLNLWGKGFQAFEKNVFLGVGPGNLHGALSGEGFPMTSEVIASFNGQHVENYFLTQLYVTGVIGFYFCMKIFYYLIKYSYSLFRLLKGRFNTFAYGGVMFCGVLSLIINSLTNPALIFDERIQFLYIFILVVVNNSNLSVGEIARAKKNTILQKFFTKNSAMEMN